MHDIRGGVLPVAGVVVTLLTPALAAASGVALAGPIDGVRAAAGCASSAFGGPADLLVLVVLVAGLARLRPRDRAGVRRGAWSFRGDRGWRTESR